MCACTKRYTDKASTNYLAVTYVSSEHVSKLCRLPPDFAVEVQASRCDAALLQNGLYR